MNKMNQARDDEIDLFELFEILWSGKWLIACFTAIALMVGSWHSLRQNIIKIF